MHTCYLASAGQAAVYGESWARPLPLQVYYGTVHWQTDRPSCFYFKDNTVYFEPQVFNNLCVGYPLTA
jgi:hypothetical protein